MTPHSLDTPGMVAVRCPRELDPLMREGRGACGNREVADGSSSGNGSGQSCGGSGALPIRCFGKRASAWTGPDHAHCPQRSGPLPATAPNNVALAFIVAGFVAPA